jgi:hypothetical protein
MKRTIGAVSLAALVLSSLTVATAPAASAVDDNTSYTCTGATTGPVQMSFSFEAEAPEPPATLTMFASPQPMTMRMESAVPGELAQEAEAAGADNVDVTVRTTFADAYPSASASWRLSTFSMSGPIDLGDQSPPAARPFAARGLHSLMQAGINDLRAGDLSVRLTFADAEGDLVKQVDLTCTTPAAPVADTVWVNSVTFLDLLVGTDNWAEAWATRTYAYGQPIPVRVRVSAWGTRKPAGWVDVTLDGVTRRVPVGADGEAVLTMPGPSERAGYHALGAAFVPADPRFYGGGAGVHPPGGTNYRNPVSIPVTFARATPQVRVTGRRANRTTRVHVRVVPEFASTPSGTVRVNLRRLGTKKHWSKTISVDVVDGRSKALAGFGKLPRGRYRLIVKYRGDADHLGSRAFETFRVRR